MFLCLFYKKGAFNMQRSFGNREGVNSYFRRIVPGFEAVSSALHTHPPCKGGRRRSMGAKVKGILWTFIQGSPPSYQWTSLHQWTLWTGGILLLCISGCSLLVCMACIDGRGKYY